jgi:rhodanese-related sulfurtransferase
LFKKYYLILVALFLVFVICHNAKGFRYYQESEKKEEKAIINKDEFKTITAEQLLEKIKKGQKLFLIDCRPEDEYNAGYLPGAVNFAVYFCIFDKDTVLKVAMEKMIDEKGKKIDLILKDRANKNVYMPKSKIIELLKYLPEDRYQEVIFYCRWPT